MKKILVSILITMVGWPAWAWAPQRAITAYIGYSAGSTNELVFRKVTEIISENNPDVKFLILARPGADGVIAQNHLIGQPADGYHVSVPSVVSLFVANDIWQKSVKMYDWDSFTNLAIMGETPSAVITHIDSKISSPKDLVSDFKQPGRPVNVAISGGTGRIAYEYFMHVIAGDRQKIQHVNYQNAGQTVIAVASKEVDYSFVPVTAARTAAESGKIKIIAVTSSARLLALPEASPLADVLPGFEIYSGWFVTLPKQTDPNIVAWYQREFSKAIRSDKYKRWAESNLIIINERRLDPAAVKSYAEKIRRELLPATQKIRPE
jgi:tripartite-type tricarboxylate transporter receptor subunit TctC